MIFASPAEVFTAFAQKKLGVHARIQVRLPIEKKVISEVRIEKDKIKSRRCRASPNGLVLTTVGRVIFNDILHPKMAFYDLALSSKQLSAHHRRLLPAAGPARDDRAARPHEGDRLPRIDALGPELRHRRPADAGRTRKRC